jgi:hypothetical protein
MRNPNLTSPRPTLKLKVAPRVNARTPPVPIARPTPKSTAAVKQKPGARWSDEYKERMQADMDKLASR